MKKIIFPLFILIASITNAQKIYPDTKQIDSLYAHLVSGSSTDSVVTVDNLGKFRKRNASAFGISGITASNGITANTSTNVKLGGALTENTTINGASNTYSFSLTNLNGFTITGNSGNLISGTNNGFVASTGANAFSGGMSYNYAAVTGTYTVLATDYLVNATANSFTITLPTAVGKQGQTFVIKNSGTATTVTVATAGGQTIDGSSTATVVAGQSITVVSTNANWIII